MKSTTYQMKSSLKLISVASFLILLLNSSCDFFGIQDTDNVSLDGLNKLVETISSDGHVIEYGGTMAPFVYREWYGWTKTQPQQPIDSLFFLKNIDGELIEKYAIKELISYDKRNQRHEYLLSNGKYFYVECDHDLNFYVSEFVDSASELKRELKRGKYINVAEKPDNW